MDNNQRIFIIFPNQLFEGVASLIQYDRIYLVDEPLYFDQRAATHKCKLAYMWTCMYEYLDQHKSVILLSTKDLVRVLKGAGHVTMYDPVDHAVLAKYTKLIGKDRVTVLDSPNFIMYKQDLNEYHALKPKGSKHIHGHFFAFVKKRLNVMKDQPSTDHENQSPLPPTYTASRETPTYHSRYHASARELVLQRWSKHPGTFNGLQWWPTNHHDAWQHFIAFLKHKLPNYGKYQDAIHTYDPFIHHSTISPMLNMGLLCPRRVLQEVLKYAKKVPMNNVEGFVRQLLGWREYMRYLYVFHHDEMIQSVPKHATRRIRDWTKWHQGRTGILPLDNEIQKCVAVTGGYAHHIVRLMIFMNMFILLRVHPEDVYRWFMEVVSMDAFDWVMKSNIYAMGYYWPRAMSRPYISGSHYIVKMSNYRATKDWTDVWDALFYQYVNDVRPPAYLRNQSSKSISGLAKKTIQVLTI